MNEHLAELNAAVEEYESAPRAGAGAFDFGLLTVLAPILLKMLVTDPALLAKLTSLVPLLVEFVQKILETFVPSVGEAAE